MTTSLELSKQLYEKGLRIDTKKWWTNKYFADTHKDNFDLVHDRHCSVGFKKYKTFPAPSADELLAVLTTFCICIYRANLIGKWACAEMFDNEKPQFKNIQFADTPSESLGKMCLWLLENGYHYNPETKMIER